jgi:hypothetical protein
MWFPEETQKAEIVDENELAEASFLNDEITGLLLQLGVNPKDSEDIQIKALEAEFHRLKNLAFTDQAADVQNLIAFKTKKRKAGGEELKGEIGVNFKFMLKEIEMKLIDSQSIEPLNLDSK